MGDRLGLKDLAGVAELTGEKLRSALAAELRPLFEEAREGLQECTPEERAEVLRLLREAVLILVDLVGQELAALQRDFPHELALASHEGR